MRYRLLIGLSMFLVPAVIAQGLTSIVLDFEDDAVGQFPADTDFCEWDLVQGSASDVNVRATGIVGANGLSLEATQTEPHCTMKNQFNRQYVGASIYVDPGLATTSNADKARVYWEGNVTGGQPVNFIQYGVGTPFGKNTVGNCHGACNSVGNPEWELVVSQAEGTACGGVPFRFETTFDWDAQTYSTEIYGSGGSLCDNETQPFEAPADSISGINFRRGNSGDGAIVRYDEVRLFYQGNVVPEFDDGLGTFLDSMGFKTAESQMFFVVGMVGLATVVSGSSLKWLAPSRMKNHLVQGVGIALGFFFVIFGFLEAWMYLMAVVLGIFTVQGAKEVRNTWAEVKENLAKRRQEQPLIAVDDDGGLVDAPLQEVGEAPEDELGEAVNDQEGEDVDR